MEPRVTASTRIQLPRDLHLLGVSHSGANAQNRDPWSIGIRNQSLRLDEQHYNPTSHLYVWLHQIITSADILGRIEWWLWLVNSYQRCWVGPISHQARQSKSEQVHVSFFRSLRSCIPKAGVKLCSAELNRRLYLAFRLSHETFHLSATVRYSH